MTGLTGLLIAISFFAVAFLYGYTDTFERGAKWCKRKLRRKPRANHAPYSEPLGI